MPHSMNGRPRPQASQRGLMGRERQRSLMGKRRVDGPTVCCATWGAHGRAHRGRFPRFVEVRQLRPISAGLVSPEAQAAARVERAEVCARKPAPTVSGAPPSAGPINGICDDERKVRFKPSPRSARVVGGWLGVRAMSKEPRRSSIWTGWIERRRPRDRRRRRWQGRNRAWGQGQVRYDAFDRCPG